LIAIGHLAKTYGILPSDVLARGTTFDLMVMDVFTTWENHQQNPTDLSNFKTEDLQKVLEKTKNGG
jgi:hypothetical protein